MIAEVNRSEVQELMRAGATVIDVLQPEVYQKGHLPGAANIPLRDLTEKRLGTMAKDQPVVVYCHDYT